MRTPLRRRLDAVLDERVAGAAETLAVARARGDEAAGAARIARAHLEAAAARRLAAHRASTSAPLGTRGLAVARSRARIVSLDREAAAAKAEAEAAAAASAAARHRLLRALVRRRALRRVLAPGRPGRVAGGSDP